MSEYRMKVEYDLATGGLKSIVNEADPYAMNWVEGAHPFGTVKDGEFVSCTETEDGLIAQYRTPHLNITAERRLIGNVYSETYHLKNALHVDVFFNRGGVGIFTPFNDDYPAADICMTNRCNTHIWCGENTSYINAVKMGPCDFGLAMVLTEGSLDTYSVERDLSRGSNDRGDFILHPSVFDLRPGQELVLSWELYFYETDRFYESLKKYPSVIQVDAKYYTLFENEKIEFSVDREDAVITLDGAEVPVTVKDGHTYVSYQPDRTGDFTFFIRSGNVLTHAKFFVTIELMELIRRRVHFIVEKQQYHNPDSALDGAYMIYDNQDKCLIFDELFPDFNASRERLVMGILVAKYLQIEKDDKVMESLLQYYRFVSREFFDEESGMVYNTIGKNPEFKRLYNGPWMAIFVMEMYKATGDEHYLDLMYRLTVRYYEVGGTKCYPNGITLFETYEVLEKAGRHEQADHLKQLYQGHVDVIVKNGLNFPPHEVNYEQTIVSPTVNMIAQMYMMNHDEKLIPICGRHADVLMRFNGLQPSYLLNNLAIRHWDGYWFGKRMTYGDTFPHAASIHSSTAFLHYYWISGDEKYRYYAYAGARDILYLFHEDGSAATSHLYPLFVNGVRCEYDDEFANEQDGALYYLIKFFNMLEE